ncbi:hypothetical protein LLH03_09050 [bacterium]|nr:hypothetical protein [bacterium]
MKEAKHMGWMLLGVVIGLGLGIYLLLKIFEWTGGRLADSPTLSIFVAVPILGGGLVGGGYLAQWLIYKREKKHRQRKRAERNAQAVGKKRKK